MSLLSERQRLLQFRVPVGHTSIYSESAHMGLYRGWRQTCNNTSLYEGRDRTSLSNAPSGHSIITSPSNPPLVRDLDPEECVRLVRVCGVVDLFTPPSFRPIVSRLKCRSTERSVGGRSKSRPLFSFHGVSDDP